MREIWWAISEGTNQDCQGGRRDYLGLTERRQAIGRSIQKILSTFSRPELINTSGLK